MDSAAGKLLDDGCIALDAGDWLAARSLFELALKTAPGPEAAYGLARAVEWAGDFETAIRLYEKAFVMSRRQGQVRLPALIAARELSFLYGAVYANAAAADGWRARSLSLLDEAGGCVERGWVHLAECLATDNPAHIRVHAAAARELGQRFADPDLEFCARSCEGLSLVLDGRIVEGMRLVDEAAAAATGGEVRDYQAAGEIYCKMLLCSELTLDVRRAQQWMEVAEGFGHRAHALWIPAICSTHYAGILTAAGRWSEAEDRLASAIHDYDASFRGLRSAAVVRLADLRLRQGRLEEAASLLKNNETNSYAIGLLARLRLANGEIDSAASILMRHVAVSGKTVLIASELALLAEVHLAAGRLEAAATLGFKLNGIAAAVGSAQYRALAEYTLGVAGLAAGDAGSRAHLEKALAYFGEAGLPLERTRCRLALARTIAPAEPELAVSEVRTAIMDFQRLGAAYDADAAAQQLRLLGHGSRTPARIGGRLTARESEVLQLLTEGHSNSQIAARLFISKRTVEHHVGSILAKLGINTRAQAQAYAHKTFKNEPA